MKNLTLLFVFLVSFSVNAYCSDLSNAMSENYPLGGWATDSTSGIDTPYGKLLLHPDFFANGYTQPTLAEVNALVATQKSLGKTKSNAIKALRMKGRQALQDSTGYALGNATTRSDFITAIRQAFLNAKAAVNACADIACVKAVTPALPADPGE